MIVVFEKGLTLRHIGHLDLMRSMQRALRRSGLPIRYSNGFNPHIQLSFAAPLSVGVVGTRELMDVPLAEEIAPEEFCRKMNATLPPLLQVRKARLVPDDFPTLMSLVTGSRIRIHMHDAFDAQAIAQALQSFMAGTECIALRKTKSGENLCNIRPFVLEASMCDQDLNCVVDNNAAGSLKPALLLRALAKIAGLEQPSYIAYRETILTRDAKGTLIPLEDYTHA